MEIKNFLDSKIIKVNIKATNKESVLKELVNTLKENDYIDNSELFLEDVYKREEEGVTGIGNYVAIPHGKSAAVKNVGVAIGVLENEIEWETLDENGVKVVILFAVGNDLEGAKTHLKLLSKFAQRLGNDEVVANLVKANSIEEVIGSFS